MALFVATPPPFAVAEAPVEDKVRVPLLRPGP